MATKLGNFKLDLKKFFLNEGKIIVKSLKRLISVKQGVKLDRAPSNKGATIKKKGFDHWLLSTGELKRLGIKFKATKDYLLIFASGKRHSGKIKTKGGIKKKTGYIPTHRELINWHTENYSGLFGELPANTKTFDRMEKELTKQLKEHLNKNLPKVININVKL